MPHVTNRFLALLLVLTALAVYQGVHTFDFINLDDPCATTGNTIVSGGVSWEGIGYAFTTTDCYGYWMPLTWISLMVDVELFGMNPGALHFTNVLIHAVAAALLFLMVNALTDRRWESFFVALLFAVHPIHVESVAWVSARKDVLSALFWFAATLAYARYARRKGAGSYALALLLFLLGLLSKPVVVTLPFTLLLLDFWPLRRFRFGPSALPRPAQAGESLVHCLAEKVPFFAVSFLVAFITLRATTSGGASVAYTMLTFQERAANALTSYAAYIGKILVPLGLGVYYPHPHPDLVPTWKWLSSAGVLACISGLGVALVSRAPFLLTGWLWFLGVLFPVIGFTQTGYQSMADRFAYIPSVGLYMMIIFALGARVPRDRFRQGAIVALTALVVILLVHTTRQQLRLWRDTVPLFEQTLRITNNNFLIHNNLGVHLFRRNSSDIRALEHYRVSLAIAPAYASALHNVGLFHDAQHRGDSARFYFGKALAADSLHTGASHSMGLSFEGAGNDSAADFWYRRTLAVDPHHVEALVSIGNLAMRHGQIDSAKRALLHAAETEHGSAEAYNGLGLVYLKSRNHDSALACFEQAISCAPHLWEPFNNLGLVLKEQGRYDAAFRAFSRALEVKPAEPVARLNRASVWTELGDHIRAKKDLALVIRADPGNARAHLLLGRIYKAETRNDSAEICMAVYRRVTRQGDTAAVQ